MRPITISEFEQRVKDFDWRGHVTAFHVHHTADPQSTWKGAASVESIRRYHVETRGYRDFAQHVTLGPDGSVWLGRDWNLAPASATGHNGRDYGPHPFMVEIFSDLRHDELNMSMRETLVRMIAAVQERFGLDADKVMFHREMQATECPGNLDKGALIAAVKGLRVLT